MMDEEYFKSLYKVDAPKDERKVLIVAGNAREANTCARKYGYKNWMYVADREQLRGQKNVIIVYYGTWPYRIDATSIAEAADDLVLLGHAEQKYGSA